MVDVRAEGRKGFVENARETAATIWRHFYPPLPENLTQRNKLVISDFVQRLLVFMPIKLLGYIAPSKYQALWMRFISNFFTRFIDKGIGDDGTVKVTVATFSGVPARVYEPRERKGNGAIIFIHGGGFVICSARTDDYLARSVSRESGLLLISIEYRLAPEHMYLAAVEDCERVALHFLRKGYEEYLVDPNKVVIMGDSAGGNLSAVTTQRLRQFDVPQPKLQVLIYPWTQMLDFKLPSYVQEERCERTSMLSPTTMAWFTLHYLVGDDIGHYINDLLNNKHITPELRHSPSFDHLSVDRLPPEYRSGGSTSNILHDQQQRKPGSPLNSELYTRMQPYLLDRNVSPLIHPNLEGTPATMVLTVGIDPLRDEGILYVEKLRKARVNVVHQHYPTAYHGIACMPGLELSAQMIKDMTNFIQENL